MSKSESEVEEMARRAQDQVRALQAGQPEQAKEMQSKQFVLENASLGAALAKGLGAMGMLPACKVMDTKLAFCENGVVVHLLILPQPKEPESAKEDSGDGEKKPEEMPAVAAQSTKQQDAEYAQALARKKRANNDMVARAMRGIPDLLMQEEDDDVPKS